MHNVVREFIIVTSLSDPQSVYTWYMAKLQNFPSVWAPATTFLASFLATCLLLVASLVSSMPGLMVTKASRCYSCMEQVWLLVVVSKPILSVLLVDTCGHLTNEGREGEEGNFFACCNTLEEFTNFRIAIRNSSKIASQLSNYVEEEYSGVVTCKVDAFYAFRDLGSIRHRSGLGVKWQRAMDMGILVCDRKGASTCYQKTWLKGGRQTPKRHWLLFSAQVLYSTEVQRRSNFRSVEARLNAQTKTSSYQTISLLSIVVLGMEFSCSIHTRSVKYLEIIHLW